MADNQTPDNTYSENYINSGVDNGSLDFKGWDDNGNAYWEDDNGNSYYQMGSGSDDTGSSGDGGSQDGDHGYGTPYWGNYDNNQNLNSSGNNYTANGHNAGGTTFGDNYGGNQSNGYWGNYGQNPYANNPYGNNPYNSNPYNSNPYNSNPYSSNPYGAPTGQAGNAGPVTSSWPGSNIFPPAAPPPAPKATPPPKMTPMLIQQTVLGNDRVQQAINNGMTVTLDRNNLVGNVPTATTQVLVPGLQGAGTYTVTFKGPLHPDSTPVAGKTTSYSYPPLPGSGQSRLVVKHTPQAPAAPKQFQAPPVTSLNAATPNPSVANMYRATGSKLQMMLLLPQVITSAAVPPQSSGSTSEKQPPYIVYLYVDKDVHIREYSINLQEVKEEAERIYRENGLNVSVQLVSYDQGEKYARQKEQGKLPINRHVIKIVTPDNMKDKDAAGQTPTNLSEITLLNAYFWKDYDHIGRDMTDNYTKKYYPLIKNNYKNQVNYQLGYSVAHEALHELIKQLTYYFELNISTSYEENSGTANNNIFNLTNWDNEAFRDHNIGRLNLLHPAAIDIGQDPKNNIISAQPDDPQGIPWFKNAPWSSQMERINLDEIHAIKLFFNITNMKQMPQLKLLLLKALARESILNFK